MFLEVSNIAAAIGKNPYEPIELIYLNVWARENPTSLLNYLITNKLIENFNLDEDEVDDEMNMAYSNVMNTIDKQNFTTKDFDNTTDQIMSEYKKIRPNYKQKELEQLESSVKNQIVKENGNIQEDNTIHTKKYVKGNNKMWYYKIDDNVIGGKHDADENHLVIEIKSRTSLKNIRKNEYDLYQLIGYLMCMKKNMGKIVQNFNKEIYDSDVENSKEYGIINLEEQKWKLYEIEIINKLKIFFVNCKYCIENEQIDISKIFKFGKIADITKDGRLVNINSKLKKI